jgi:hypothetical protein
MPTHLRAGNDISSQKSNLGRKVGYTQSQRGNMLAAAVQLFEKYTQASKSPKPP